jgi:hypothetical protein
MQMVRHDDKSMKRITAFGPVCGKDVEEEIGVLLDLEETTAVRCDGGDEVSAELLRRRERHWGRIKEDPGLKPLFVWPRFRDLKAPAPSGFALRANVRCSHRESSECECWTFVLSEVGIAALDVRISLRFQYLLGVSEAIRKAASNGGLSLMLVLGIA